ncbi:MAG: DUF2304 domain-containing protein [Candidatus Rokuibacteriota bacterium]
MIIRVLLLSALALLGWRVFLKRTRLPVHIIVVFTLLALAGAAVLFPDATNDIAHVVGVGRGADLIMYMLHVGLLFVIIHYYTKFVELQQQITHLVREIALLRREVEKSSATPPEKEP